MKRPISKQEEQNEKDLYEFWKRNSVLSWDEFKQNYDRSMRSDAIRKAKEVQKKKIR